MNLEMLAASPGTTGGPPLFHRFFSQDEVVDWALSGPGDKGGFRKNSQRGVMPKLKEKGSKKETIHIKCIPNQVAMERDAKNHHNHLQFSEEILKKWMPAEAKSLAQGPPSLHGPEEETRRERLRRLMLGIRMAQGPLGISWDV